MFHRFYLIASIILLFAGCNQSYLPPSDEYNNDSEEHQEPDGNDGSCMECDTVTDNMGDDGISCNVLNFRSLPDPVDCLDSPNFGTSGWSCDCPDGCPDCIGCFLPIMHMAGQHPEPVIYEDREKFKCFLEYVCPQADIDNVLAEVDFDKESVIAIGFYFPTTGKGLFKLLDARVCGSTLYLEYWVGACIEGGDALTSVGWLFVFEKPAIIDNTEILGEAFSCSSIPCDDSCEWRKN